MPYIDGMLAAVRNEDKAKFIEYARQTADVFKRCGATAVVENWGDEVPDGELTSMPMAVKCEPGETVVFSWIIWPDKETHNAGWEKVMADPLMQMDENPMPFDGKRMIYGRFETILDM